MPKFDRYWNPKNTVRVQSNKFRNRLEQMGAKEEWDQYFAENPNTAPWQSKEFGNNPYRFAGYLRSGGGEQPQQPQTYTLQSDYWLDPRNVGLWYDRLTTGTYQVPAWMDSDTQAGIKQLYKYWEGQNKGKPYSEWAPLKPDDPAMGLIARIAHPESEGMEKPAASLADVQSGKAAWTDLAPDVRQRMLADPNFYKNGISQFDISVRDQILNDQNFQWNNLPRWQQVYYDIMSSPAIMASPMALAGARAGGSIFGVPGKIGGAIAGYVLGYFGGQDYNPVGTMKDQPTVAAKVMYGLNYLATKQEQFTGYSGQLLDAAIAGMQGNKQAGKAAYEMLFDPIARQAAWEAGKYTYEYADFAGTRNWLPFIEDVLNGERGVTYAEGGQDFIIGQAEPVDKARALGHNPITGKEEYVTDVQGVLQEARHMIRTELEAGRDPKEVEAELFAKAQAYVGGQLGDFVGQMAGDPNDMIGRGTDFVVAKIADVDAHVMGKIAERLRAAGDVEQASAYDLMKTRAQRVSQAFTGGESIGDAYRKWKANLQVTPVEELGRVEKWLGGITDEGTIKKLGQTPKGLAKVQEFFTGLTPRSKAIMSLNMASENLAAYLNMFDNVDDLTAHFKQLQGTDNKAAAEFGARMLNSPEWYTIFPAMKNYDLGTDVARWRAVEPNIAILDKVAEVLGESKERVIKDLSNSVEVKRDFQRIIDNAQKMGDNTAAKDLLAAAEAGRFTPESLTSIVKVFHENGAPYTFEMWKAQTIGNMGEHFAKWAEKFYGLKPDDNIWKGKLAPILKRAQSLALLGVNPGNFVQNEIGNIVSRMATGNYGYISPKAAAEWLDRFGFKPARYGEGVGFTGEAAGKGGTPGMDVINKATQPEYTGLFKTANDVINAVNKVGVFGKLNEFVEGIESRNAFLISMKRMWNETWKAGKGFRTMDAELAQRLNAAGFDEGTVYRLIENGLNMNEIENALYKQEAAGQARTILEAAAQRMGRNADEAIRVFSELGILDELDARLKKAKNAQQRLRVFSDVTQRAQDMMDARNAQDIAKRIEHVKNKVATEGGLGVVNIVDEIEGGYFDRWINHYLGYGELWETVNEVPNEWRDTMILDYERENRAAWNRTNAYQVSNYKALFEGLGVNHPLAQDFMAAMAEYQRVYGEAYQARYEMRLGLRDKWAGKLDDPGFWEDVKRNNAEVQKVFDEAHVRASAQMEAMQKSLAKLMGELYGERVGLVTDEVFHQWREFRDGMVKDLAAHRERIANMDAAQRRIANEKFYQQDYPLKIEQFREMKRQGAWAIWTAINGGDASPAVAPKGDGGGPFKPAGGGSEQAGTRTRVSAEDINGLMAAAEQRQAADAAAIKERVSAIWDVAEDYARVGLPYDRTILQDKFALLNALRKAEYGGIPDLVSLEDPRATPEFVRQVLDARKVIKEAEAEKTVRKALVNAQEAASNIKAPRINENTTILKAISEHGGIDLKLAQDLTGEKRPKTAPGVFTRKGVGIDEMARMLADDGYPIDLNDPGDPGGIRQTTALLDRARNGDKVYPVNHDYEAALARAQDEAAAKAFADTINMEAIQEIPFDVIQWDKDFESAAKRGDLNKLYQAAGDLPEELNGARRPALTAEAEKILSKIDEGGAMPAFVTQNLRRVASDNGIIVTDKMNAQDVIEAFREKARGSETWEQYVSRVIDETVARVESERKDLSIAEASLRADAAMERAKARGDMVMTRETFREQLVENMGLPREQADAVVQVTDARAEAWAKLHGKTAEEWYATRLGDVVRGGGEGGLKQEAYHGSPYKFDKFTLDHIGSGEGAQAYGWGLYFADDKAVAEYYRKSLAAKSELNKLNGELRHIASEIDKAKYQKIHSDAKNFYTKYLAELETRYDDVLNRRDSLVKGDHTLGQTYKVDVPDEGYLLWDKPLSEQPEVVKNILAKIQEGYRNGTNNIYIGPEDTGRQIYNEIVRAFQQGNLEPLQRTSPNSFRGDQNASLYLKEAGINGIKYLDGSSRGKGEGSYNYVIFDDNAVKILETYYQGHKGAVTFMEDGRAVIHAFEKADFSTAIHELGHVFRRDLPAEDLSVVEEWVGVKDGVWKTEHEEKFARGFERYVADGEAPTPKLKAVFAKFKAWMLEIYRSITGSAIDIEIPDKVRKVFDRMLGANGLPRLEVKIDEAQKAADIAEIKSTMDFDAIKLKAAEFRKMREKQESGPLFQSADPRMPPGGYDEMSGGFLPESRVLDEGWTNYVGPLMNEMKKVAGEGAFRAFDMQGLDAETQAMLRRYVNQVRGDMATSKLMTTRFGEMQRDLALLNYNNRSPFGAWIDTIYPYRFWGTETMKNWFVNAPDRIGWYARYARIQQMLNKHERDWPERLRGRIKIPAPYLPDWMGDSIYIDPMRMIFQFTSPLAPFETMARDNQYQLAEAQRILQEWSQDGTYSEAEIQQALTGQGPVWEKALAEAKIRRESQISGPMDFMNMMMGPAFYLTTPYYLATGHGEKISETPMLKTTRAFETATKGTWLDGLGKAVGMLGKPEQWLREKAGLPEFGEYGDYYIRRQLSNMVADGTEIDGKPVSPDEAMKAMIEKQGPLWDMARERVAQELMMRVPGMGALYAGTHGASLGEMLLAVPESVFGAQLLPEGELRYRGLKEKWDAAWRAYDNGDKKAVQRFFDDHPEYEAYLMKNKDPEAALRSFLTGQIWDRYMALDKGNQRVVRAQMGDLFQRAFLDKETRSVESIDVQTLAVWARILGGMVPQTPETKSVMDIPQTMMPRLEGLPPEVSAGLNNYYRMRDERFPNITAIQSMYYSLPKSEQYKFKLMYPELAEYWAWRRDYIQKNPAAAPFLDSKTAERIMQGKQSAPYGMSNEQLKRLLLYYNGDEFAAPGYTAEFYLKDATPILMTQLDYHRLTGAPLGAGAMAELQMIWEANGKPGGSLQSFVDDLIVPTMP